METVRYSDTEMTCSACPSQWEGRTVDNKPIYIRYRWGRLTVQIWGVGKDIFDEETDGEYIFDQQLGDAYHGVMDTEEMMEATKSVIQWDT